MCDDEKARTGSPPVAGVASKRKEMCAAEEERTERAPVAGLLAREERCAPLRKRELGVHL